MDSLNCEVTIDMAIEDDLYELDDQFIHYTAGADYERLRFDLEKIVVKDTTLNKTIAIDLTEYNPAINNLESYLLNTDLSKNNMGLDIYYNKGFSFKRYNEFLLDIVPISQGDILKEYEFKLNGYKVKVGEPSSLFKLLIANISFDSYSDGWNGFYTISIDGVDTNEVDKLIEAALFIYSHTASQTLLEYPKVQRFLGKWEVDEYYHHSFEELKKADDNYDLDYYQVLGLYNNGKRKSDSLSYYRVLEYFFLINHKQEIVGAVNEYNQSNNDTTLVDKIRSLFSDSEQSLLLSLLKGIDIDDIIQLSHTFGLIREKTLYEFSKELYLFRNKIVHSKDQSKFEIIIPTNVTDETQDQWLIILEKIAFRAITNFCLD